MIHLLLDHPYFGYLAGKVRFVGDAFVETTALSVKGGLLIKYNEQWFDQLSEKHQKGTVIHELLHLALLHPFRREERQKKLWQMACDIAVSEFMDTALIHEGVVTRFQVFQTLAIEMSVQKSAEYYYRKLLAEEDRIELTYDNEALKIVLDNKKTFTSAPLEEGSVNDLQMQALIQSLAGLQSVSTMEGVIPSALGEITDTTYAPYKQNWRNMLKLFLSGQGRIRSKKTYKRVSRRFDNVAGNKRDVGVKALIAVDESGSVSNEQVAAFHQELLRINKITGTDMEAVAFDTVCTEPMSLPQFIRGHKRQKQGGTDFRPVFELADKRRMPVVIIFTDGDGEAPDRVNQKVLWVLTDHGRAPADYGMVVHYNEK